MSTEFTRNLAARAAATKSREGDVCSSGSSELVINASMLLHIDSPREASITADVGSGMRLDTEGTRTQRLQKVDEQHESLPTEAGENNKSGRERDNALEEASGNLWNELDQQCLDVALGPDEPGPHDLPIQRKDY